VVEAADPVLAPPLDDLDSVGPSGPYEPADDAASEAGAETEPPITDEPPAEHSTEPPRPSPTTAVIEEATSERPRAPLELEPVWPTVRRTVEGFGSKPPTPRKLINELKRVAETGAFGDDSPTDGDFDDLIRQCVDSGRLRRVRKGFSTVLRLRETETPPDAASGDEPPAEAVAAPEPTDGTTQGG